MPLYKRTLFCVPSSHLPENNAKFKEGEEYFRVRVTKELFSDYSEYIKTIEKYRECNWSCKITGRSGLTFEEALLSEQKAVEQAQQFPECYIGQLCQLVHHSIQSIDSLVDKFHTHYKENFVKGEAVEILQNKTKSGTVIDVNDGVVQVELEDKSRVPLKPSELKKQPLTKIVIKQKIREIADKDRYKGAPWVIVDRKIMERFNLTEQLPADLQELKDAYDKKQKRVEESSEEEQETEELHKKKKKKVMVDEVHYPTNDELFTHDKTKIRPPGATDFTHNTEYLMELLMTWKFLRTFSKELRLFPFELEDLENSLAYEDSDEAPIIVETHRSLLRALTRRSVSASSWQDTLCSVLRQESRQDNSREDNDDESSNDQQEEEEKRENLGNFMDVVNTIKEESYAALEMKDKVSILAYLCDEVVETDAFRGKIDGSLEDIATIEKEKRESDIQQRKKQREESTSVSSTEEQKWKKNETFDKKLSAVRHYIRSNPLGQDRDFNRYWFVSEHDPRVLVEMHAPSGDVKWEYYSTKSELDELLEYLDTRGKRELALKESIEKKYSKIVAAMNKRHHGYFHEPPRRSERLLRPGSQKIIDRSKPFLLYTNKLEE